MGVSPRRVFVAGGTGYMGSNLMFHLLERGHSVRALARPGSETKVPRGCEVVTGNALDGASYIERIQTADTFVQLVGVPHPSPAKAGEFRSIDLVAGREAVAAAVQAGIRHFVYVSVAHPAPVMKAYIAVRRECEAMICASGLPAIILRPWYVLGPGRRWPYALLPLYWFFEKLSATRQGAQRLGLVTREQMIKALLGAIENPPEGTRILGVPEIRNRHIASGAKAAVAL